MTDLHERTHEPIVYADLSDMDIQGPDRQKWLDLRRNGLGSSDAAPVVGVSPWASAFEIWQDKKGRLAEKELTREMEWGIRLEDSVARWFADETGLEVHKPTAMYQHPSFPFMLSNPDREIGDDAILECKTTDKRHADDWEFGPPLHYALQTNHQLAVSGLPRAYVAVLIGGNDPRYFELERDDELIEMLIQAEERFWVDYVVADVEPPVTAMASDAAILSNIYDPTPGSEVILPPDGVRLLLDRAHAKAAVKASEALITECENQLKQLLGDHEIGIGVDGTVLVTWKKSKPKKFQQKLFQADHPDLYEQYRIEGTQRTFLSKVDVDDEEG